MLKKERIIEMKSKAKALYVHIPFCRNICTYCDFKKFIYNQQRINEYFKSLFLQLESLKENKYKSIYIGGGTPSCIDEKNLTCLLKTLSLMLDKNYKEFCIESNVEDLNDKFLTIIKENKINRLSIGVQTFNDKYIKYCNRRHTKQMAIDNINKASTYINNLSIDMIFAYQDQSVKELKEDIKIATSLPIKHISYYSLLIEPNTVLYAKNVSNVCDDIQAKMYKCIVDTLKKNGFDRYEISNFAKNKKYQSYHNKIYWHNKHYDAIGIAASGYKNNLRYTNNDNIVKYINNDFSLIEETVLSKEDIMFDQIMLNLRLDEGLDINAFNKRFKVDFKEKFKDAIKYNLDNKLIRITKNKIKTTFKGSLLLNVVLEAFLEN